MIVLLALLVRLVPGDVPVDPDADQAKQWIVQELSKPEYQAAQPTWFDKLSAAFSDWFASLFHGNLGAASLPVLIVVALLVVGAIVAAFFIFGAPRRNRRSTIAGAIFGDDDDRDAATMRRAAQAAAASGEWGMAIQEMFRAIARSLAERTVVDTSPGTTATGFAVRAGRSFPAHSDRLAAAAVIFDGVRYLGRAGTPAAYEQTAAIERDLREARPVFDGASAAHVGAAR